MVLLLQKLASPLKFSSILENHHRSSSDALRDFRSKISGFINQTWLKPEPRPEEFLSQTGFNKCFELIHIANRAFAGLVVETDHPMSKWSGKLTESYLSYTLISLDLLNAVSSSVSHLNQAKISISHAVNSSTAKKHLKKITGKNSCKNFKISEGSSSIRFQRRPGFEKEETAVFQALVLFEKIVFMSLGFVLSGLCGDAEAYVAIRKYAEGFDDSLMKELDLRFCKEIQEKIIIMEEVKEVNRAIEQISVEELKMRLKKLENSIQDIEKETSHLFSEILAARNKMLDNLRL